MNRIGIIGAMDEEVDILVELMEIKETIEKASLKFYKGILEGKEEIYRAIEWKDGTIYVLDPLFLFYLRWGRMNG